MPVRRAPLLLPVIAAAAFACAKPPPARVPCGANGSRPHFDPASARCDCVVPQPAPWQAAAPRGPSEVVREKESARLALRRIGTADFAEKDVEVEVLAPNGTAASGVGTLIPPEWVLLQFPADFPLGTFHRAGIYTVLWRADGAVVACDGFVIDPQPAPPPVEATDGAAEPDDGEDPGEDPASDEGADGGD